MHPIAEATISDAREILALQKKAYQSEALLYPGIDLPPMVQTLEEMQENIRNLTVLKAVSEGRIIGSVRAGEKEGVCSIGRLIVSPDMQRMGLGTRLMTAIEEAFCRVSAYELFTGEKSIGNLRFYENLGYSRIQTRELRSGLTLVFLRKSPPGQEATDDTTEMIPGKPY